MRNNKITLIALFVLTMTTAVFAAENWKEKLRKELPLLSHGNWIVVADSAYPLQIAPGIETICGAADQLTVVKEMLAELDKAKHVKPTIYTDAEMQFVDEKNAPGVGAYRNGLGTLLADKPVQNLRTKRSSPNSTKPGSRLRSC
jgi:hypothetical protein